MTPEERELTKKWIETWRRAGPELERIRRQEIRRADIRQFIQLTAGMLPASLRDYPARAESGLVQQQAIFSRRRS